MHFILIPLKEYSLKYKIVLIKNNELFFSDSPPGWLRGKLVCQINYKVYTVYMYMFMPLRNLIILFIISCHC